MNDYVLSLAFQRLSENSRKSYIYAMNTIAEHIGDVPIDKVRRSTGIKLQQELKDTPAKANLTMAVFSVLMKYAVDLDLREINPLKGIDTMQVGEWECWPDHAVDAFKLASTGMVRRAFYLCLYTGQRIGDVLNMKWSDISDGGRYINVTQQKTGRHIIVPLHHELTLEMSGWPDIGDHILFYVNRAGEMMPVSHNIIYSHIRSEQSKLGLTGLTIHGLRKNAAKMMAEAGCTDREIMSITGHTTTEMVGHYTKGAEQKRLAENAMQKLEKFCP
jgi:integrase